MIKLKKLNPVFLMRMTDRTIAVMAVARSVIVTVAAIAENRWQPGASKGKVEILHCLYHSINIGLHCSHRHTASGAE